MKLMCVGDDTAASWRGQIGLNVFAMHDLLVLVCCPRRSRGFHSLRHSLYEKHCKGM